MNLHNQIHNDIKPQNFLVKFCAGDLSLIEIVLTDFGLAGSDSKGGTPIFASPECLAYPDRKDKSADMFSLGRLFLFMTLAKERFLTWLFVPLVKDVKPKIMDLITQEPMFNLISKMTQIKNRIDIQSVRIKLDSIDQIRKWSTIGEINYEINISTTEYTSQYIDNLKHIS